MAEKRVQKADGSVEITTADAVDGSRLTVDTLKWYLCKLAPKKYGDKIDAARLRPSTGYDGRGCFFSLPRLVSAPPVAPRGNSGTEACDARFYALRQVFLTAEREMPNSSPSCSSVEPLTGVNQLWVADITYIRLHRERVFSINFMIVDGLAGVP